MGGGSGGDTTTKTDLPSWAQPYAKEILARGSALSNQDAPQYTGDTTAGLTDDQLNAMDMVRQRATQGDPGIQAAQGAITGMMSNGGNAAPTQNNPYASYQGADNPYIGSNPYLQAQVQKAQGDVSDAYKTGTASQTMSQFRNAGAFGGSAQQQQTNIQNKTLADTLSNTATQMYGADYANTQQMQQAQNTLNAQIAGQNANYTNANNSLNSSNYNAAQDRLINGSAAAQNLGNQAYTDAGQLGTSGALLQNANQADLDALYNQWYNSSAGYGPYQQLNVLSNSLGQAMGVGNQGETTGPSNKPSAGQAAMAGAATGASIGSAFPGWGTAIGAGVGAIGGYLSAR